MGLSRSGRSFLLAVGAGFCAFLVAAHLGRDVLGFGWLVAAGLGVLATVVVEIWVFLFEMQRQPNQTRSARAGPEGLIGARGLVLRSLDPVGSVLVHGDVWTARSAQGKSILRESSVEVRRVDGLSLIVEPVNLEVESDPSNQPQQTHQVLGKRVD